MSRMTSSKHLEGISDLTLVAEIRQGFIPTFENVTYETRLRLVMRALFKMRATAREYATLKPFVDTAERIQALLDFRLAILDTEPRKLLLSATFDRPFEPYMRLIWRPLGALLDVVFCNCEPYRIAAEHSFEDYLAWVRSVQVDSDFFYAATGRSVIDMDYLAKIERQQREGATRPPDFHAAATIADSPVEQSRAARAKHSNESIAMAFEALGALHHLTDLYPPDQPDGVYLQRAVRDLLDNWDAGLLADILKAPFREQLGWYERPLPPLYEAKPERLRLAPANVQGGILTSYDKGGPPATHGCLLLMRLCAPESPDAMKKARAFLQRLAKEVRTQQGIDEGAPGCHLNLAFTCRGLENFGVPDEALRAFPQEFREGMEDRAGLLGDIRDAHPRRWTLPAANGVAPGPAVPAAPAPPVQLAEVDFVIQLRTVSDHQGHEITGDKSHPLFAEVDRLARQAGKAGIQLVSIQSMRRAATDATSVKTHFGFDDGLSQPAAKGLAATCGDDLPLGDLLWGYRNSRDDGPQTASDYLDDGSFLVVRKLRQDVDAFETFLETQSARINAEVAALNAADPLNPVPPFTREILAAKLMGRTQDGKPLVSVAGPGPNDFNYDGDKDGSACPFQSHVRRTNPRGRDEGGRPNPRIMRRGMSYGPCAGVEAKGEERGVFFMAYNASLAEQFETIQRWVNGANSTGVGSAQNDPLIGSQQSEDARVFRFCHGGRPFRVVMEKPYVELRWGLYLFAPSLAALARIAAPPAGLAAAARGAVADGYVRQGETIIQRLGALADAGRRDAAARGWKICLEDFSAKDPGERGDAPALAAAVSRLHGGALRIPYGTGEGEAAIEDAVLITDAALVKHAFEDTAGNYSMRGQLDRMRRAIGPIYLGLDEGPEYQAEAMRVNPELMKVDERDAFAAARKAAEGRLGDVLDHYQLITRRRGGKLDLHRDFITPTLADICRYWFGVPDGPRLKPGEAPPARASYHVGEGGWSWEPPGKRNPVCPGDFMAISRYFFYPDPNPQLVKHAQAQGQALRLAMRQGFQELRQTGWPPTAPLAAKMAIAFNGNDDLLARTMIGVMMGFLPPADGCLRSILFEWLGGELWRLQRALWTDVDPDPFARADRALRPALVRAMQKRPSPDLLWRTSVKRHQVGDLWVEEGERVFIDIAGATAEARAAGSDDLYPVFGGDRRQSAPPPPTHACPAYRFALGTMLGMLSALLETGRIEELPPPLIVEFSAL
jgi:Dyp-type peroxidase family